MNCKQQMNSGSYSHASGEFFAFSIFSTVSRRNCRLAFPSADNFNAIMIVCDRLLTIEESVKYVEKGDG